MGLTAWGDTWSTAAMADTSMFQTISFDENTVLQAVRTWIIGIGNPTFTSLTMKIYSNEVVAGANTPRVLLWTSTNAPTKAEIFSKQNGCREIYFEFGLPALRAGEKYNLVINATGYTYAELSHLAWRKAWPDPVNKAFTPTIENLALAPYALYAIGGDF